MASIENVVANGVCVGCGGCQVATGGAIPVAFTTRGYYQADLSQASPEAIEVGSRVCPFSDDAANEDAISDKVFPDLKSDPRIGSYSAAYAARVNDEAIVDSSSGGMTTYLLRALLAENHVDGIIHVGQTDQPIFDYVVSRTVDELEGRTKSRYHPASFGEVVDAVRGDGKRYAFVGVPCAVRSARLVCETDLELSEQLVYFVGLVCGHLKSAAYAESFAWQLDVVPDEIEEVDFRIKNPGLLSRQYSFGVKKWGSDWRTAQTVDLLGGSWGHAVFQLEACNYCDDIFAETADVVCGDAWLPRFEAEWRGTNVIVSRNETIDQIIKRGHDSDEIWSEPLDLDAVAKTQAGNFRHRREGLSIRLKDDQINGRWAPIKRVKAGSYRVSRRRKRLMLRRRELSRVSHDLFANAKDAGDLRVYTDAITPLIEDYERISKPSFFSRLKKRSQREFWMFVRRTRTRGKR